MIGGPINYGQPINYGHSLNRGLVAWWLCLPNWIGGGTWKDLTRRYNGVLTNIELGTDWWTIRNRPGGWGCLDLGGSNEWVDVSLVAPTDKTFALWLNLQGLVGSFNTIMEFGGDSPWFGVNGDRACLVFGSASTDNSIIVDNTWTHIAYTSDSALDVSQMYINGIASGAASGSNTATGDGLGIGWNTTDSALVGRLDDIRIYDRALSATEVKSLYLESLMGYPSLLNRSKLFIGDVLAAGPSFKSAWARNSNILPLGV
jgi:hypothetical protein